MVRMIVGVGGFSFDSSHYTRGVSEKCMNLHGHTFKLYVEVEGEVDPETGMVIDFGLVKRVVRRIVEEYDHKVIVPRRDLEGLLLRGRFKSELKVIDYPEATTEYIALDIAMRIYEELKMPIRVKLYEGENNYVIVEWRG
ncbi:MAG: 6-pyruvoyl tetrahydropterin synthase [Desulfurococcales archaeon ex4484_58]|nr:MAG: 6-pyruvoyl tetrahydropterin synthase [Desulfurococcales archaeon ex4484_58]